MTAAPAVVAATSEGDSRALLIRKLRKEYRPGVPVLKDIDLAIPGRGMTAVIGPSGTGKSTLIRCINRLVEPTAGEILFRGQDLAKLSGLALRQARRRIGMVFQEYNLVERLTVMENLLCGRLGYVAAWRAWLRRFPRGDVERAFDLLDAVGLSGFATRRADALSGGQRQRVGIARALYGDPQLIMLDEATSALDNETEHKVASTIAALHGDTTLIVVAHRLSTVRHCDQLIFMQDGRIEGCGTFDEVRATNAHFARLVELGNLDGAPSIEVAALDEPPAGSRRG
jgi:phosphonate transport system ATP-binding protein